MFFICVDESTRLYLHGKDIRRIMMKENIKNQIIDVDGYIRVVNGRVICFKSDVYDLNNPNDVADLLSFVDDLSEPDNLFSGQIGDDTVIDLRLNPKNNEVIVGFGGYLPCLVEHLDVNIKEKVMGV